MIKFSMVTVGVAAGLLAAAPLASAGEAPKSSGSHDRSADCTFTAGDGGDAEGGEAGGELALTGGLGGSNVGNIANCSEILSNNDIGPGGELPEFPAFPSIENSGGSSSLVPNIG